MERITVTEEAVLNRIFMIRGLKVMVDSDLAELYGVETKALNQAVNRNINRFPEDFMFQLTDNEWMVLRSQFVTANWNKRRGSPNVFTEHGVLMLSSVLNSERAVNVNIQVMRIFNRTRQLLFGHTELRLEIEKIKGKIENQGKNLELVFNYLDELINKKQESEPRKRIGFRPDEL